MEDFYANFLTRMKLSAFLRMTKMVRGNNFVRSKLVNLDQKGGWVVRRLCMVSEKLSYCKLNDLGIILIRTQC